MSLPPARVQLLDDRLINQIAAGEVVERPASVLKELVENALDAGARQLRVSLRGGGRELVQVEDDGHGMDRQDALLSVERHATSKIRRAEDLAAIRTLGFRGEALPSIAAVSHFELLTRRAADPAGTRVLIDGGRLVEAREAGCPPGTRITVRSLFFNLPARRKFLRTEATELQHAQDMLLALTLMRTDLGVELLHEGRPLLRAQADQPLSDRIEALLGIRAEELLPVELRGDELPGGLALVGRVCSPERSEASARGSLWLHVNGRAVRDPLLRRAVLDAYRGVMARGRFPVAVLDLRIDPTQVDVNVHPTKAEIRLREAHLVQRWITESLRACLEGAGVRPLANPGRAPVTLGPVAAAHQPALPGLAPAPPSPGPALLSDRWAFAVPVPAPPAPPDPLVSPEPSVPPRPSAPTAGQPPLAAAAPLAEVRPPSPAPGSERPAQPPPRAEGPPRAIGLLQDDLLLADAGGDLLLVDLPRARAALLCQALLLDREPRPLLAPVLVELEAAEAAALLPLLPALRARGIELEPFGGSTLRLLGLCPPLVAAAGDRLVRALAAAARVGATADELQRVAVEQAVGPARPLSPYEQRVLLSRLDPREPGLCLRIEVEELRRRLRGERR